MIQNLRPAEKVALAVAGLVAAVIASLTVRTHAELAAVAATLNLSWSLTATGAFWTVLAFFAWYFAAEYLRHHVRRISSPDRSLLSVLAVAAAVITEFGVESSYTEGLTVATVGAIVLVACIDSGLRTVASRYA